MRRVKPNFWHIPGESRGKPFCKRAADGPEGRGALVLVTDPAVALEYWKTYDFDYMVGWARDGFPGPCLITPYGDVWILSPDPGKEIDGDSVNDA